MVLLLQTKTVLCQSFSGFVATDVVLCQSFSGFFATGVEGLVLEL